MNEHDPKVKRMRSETETKKTKQTTPTPRMDVLPFATVHASLRLEMIQPKREKEQ